MAYEDGNKDFASKGIAGSALGLGIAGTALALLQNNGNGLNGLLGGGGFNHGGRGGAAVEIAYDMEKRMAGLEARVAAQDVAIIKDKEIADLKVQLTQANLLRYVDDKTCGMIKGNNFLSPRQMADPYMGSPQVLSTHPPVIEVDRNRSDCERYY
jgi:hypothetical protein